MARAAEIASQFPRSRRLNTASAGDYIAAPEDTFEFGLQTILHGLEAQLITRGPRRPEPIPRRSLQRSA